MSIPKDNISAVILAGGRGSRFGGADKGLIKLLNKPLIEYVINNIKPQVKNIMISANRNLETYQQYGYEVYPDESDDFAGPLAGILKALQQVQNEWLVTVPADGPFIPTNLIHLLVENDNENIIKDKLIVIPHDGEHLQPTFALLHKSLLPSLLDFLNKGERKTRVWMLQQPHLIVDFSKQADAFININSSDDLALAEKHLNKVMS